MPHQHVVEATYRRNLTGALAGVSDHFTAGGVKLTSGYQLTFSRRGEVIPVPDV